MDEVAVLNAEEKVLRKHGIERDGVLIKLRLMCASNSDTTLRKRELKSFIESERKPGQNRDKKSAKTTAKKTVCKTLYISWENFDTKKDKYSVVKTSRGGGCRKIAFKATGSREELLQYCISVFWNNKKHSLFQATENYHFMLADYKRDILGDHIKNAEGREVPFTVSDYCEANKMTRHRIYLFTKLKSVATMVRQMYEKVDVTISSDSDFEADDKTDWKSVTSFTSSTPVTSHSAGGSQLVGTTEERLALRNEIATAYNESLEIDQEKERQAI